MSTIGNNIRLLRESKKWTKKEMSIRLNFNTYTTITKWEKGLNHPKGSDIVRLCKLFGVTSDQLLGFHPLNNSNFNNNYYMYFSSNMINNLIGGMDKIKEENKTWITIPDCFFPIDKKDKNIFFIEINNNLKNERFKQGDKIGIERINNFDNLKDMDLILITKDRQIEFKEFLDIKSKCIKTNETYKDNKDSNIKQDETNDLIIHGKISIHVHAM